MKTTTVIYALCLVLISIFLLSYLWEFALEDVVQPFFTDDFRPEPRYERWEYVITATLFAALALVLPAWWLIKTAGRLRSFSSELEERIDRRTQELSHELDERLRVERALRNEIHERERAETLSARLGRIIENSLPEVYVLDAETLNFIQVNRRGRDNLGLTMEQLQNRSCADLVPGWTRESLEKTLEPLRAGTRDELVLETAHQREDGSQYDVECRIQYLPIEHPPVFVIMLQDISVRKQMEAQLVEARDRAEAASAAKSLFLASISHELRTPVSSMIGMSDVLGHESLSAQQQHYVRTIHDSGTAFLDIIDGLLDLSMIESGKFRPRQVEFQVHELIESLLDMLAYRACQRGLELLSLVEADVPLRLCGDALALRQILLNLLGNAIKYTEKGTVDLHLSLASGSAQRCRLRLAVRDSGPGIPAELQEALFQPFTQGGAPTQGHAGGVGLGLSICKSLIESLQGTLGVDSVEGEGSLFWCEIEFVIVTATAAETAAAYPFTGQRGLVVDDNPLARSILQSQLEAVGLLPDTVDGAMPALDVLRRAVIDGDPYTFALIDSDMPGIDGLSLALAIKSDETLAATRLLLMTAVVTPISGETQQRIGFEMQCAKPIRQSQLPDILTSLLDSQLPGQEEALAASSVTTDEAGPLRVLVVDDQPVNLEFMQILLRRLGCQVTVADSAEQALPMLEEHRQDAVFMDCLMPGMDGYAATAAIRRRESGDRHVVIIAMTALTVPGERDRCLAAGMDDYLTKPVNEPLLKKILQRWFPETPLDKQKSGAAAPSSELATPLRRLLAGQPEQLARLVDLFVDNTGSSLQAMQEMVERGQAGSAELVNMAHALKGSCLHLGLKTMADLCSSLEAAGHSADRYSAETALTQLSETFEQARAELLDLAKQPATSKREIGK